MALVTGLFVSEVFGFGPGPQEDLTAFIGLALLGAGYAHVRIAKLEAAVGKNNTDSES
jgi:hypothetical protein